MIVLCVLLGLLSLVLLLLFSSVHLRIRWEEEIKVRIRFWFVSLDLLRLLTPEKESKKKKDKKTKPKVKKKEEAVAVPAEKKKRSFSDWMGFLKFFSRLLGEMIGELVARLRVRVKKLRLTVAASEPSRTALLYGIASPLVYQLCEAVNRFTKSEISYKNVGVYSDFSSDHIKGSADITLSLRLIDLLFIGAPALAILPRMKYFKGGSQNERDPVEASY